MKKFILSLLMVIAASGAAFAFIDSYTIDRSELPVEAREMLDTYFPKARIGMIKIDRHLLKKPDYNVRLVNGTTIKFANSGKWKSVDCKNREVPEGLVTKTIRTHVAKKYAGTKIVKVIKKSSGYEIGLSDGVLLKYDLLGIFKGVIEIEDE